MCKNKSQIAEIMLILIVLLWQITLVDPTFTHIGLPEDFGHITSIKIRNSDINICTGINIGYEHVLTATPCLKNNNITKDNMVVVGGQSDPNFKADLNIKNIQQVYLSEDGNLAILKLETPFDSKDPYITLVPVVLQNVHKKRKCVVLQWNHTESGLFKFYTFISYEDRNDKNFAGEQIICDGHLIAIKFDQIGEYILLDSYSSWIYSTIDTSNFNNDNNDNEVPYIPFVLLIIVITFCCLNDNRNQSGNSTKVLGLQTRKLREEEEKKREDEMEKEAVEEPVKKDVIANMNVAVKAKFDEYIPGKPLRRRKQTTPRSLTDLQRFRKTAHGLYETSRIVMARKTDQRTYASLQDGKYTPDLGTFSDEGKNYEKDATAFITLKSLQHMDDFLLISNPWNCAPFADVILCCKVKNRNVIYLFQMSHKLILTELIDKEFTLKVPNKKKSKFSFDAFYEKYPRGIEEIKKIIPETYIKECSYKIIFYTNRPVENNSEIFDLEEEEQTNLFSTNDGEVYRLKRKYLAKEQDCDKRNFLQSINVYCKQHNVYNSSVLHIKHHFNTEDRIVDAITLDYFSCIRNWCGIKSEKEGLTKEFTYKLLMYATFKNFSVSLDNYKETEYKKYKQFCQKNRKERQEFLDLLWESIKNNSLTISIAHVQYILRKALEDLKKNKIGRELFYYEQIISAKELKITKWSQLEYFIGCLLGKLPFIIKKINFAIPKQYLQHFNVVSVEDGDEEPGNLLKIHENALRVLKQQIIISRSGQYFKIKDIFDAISNKASISNLLSLIVDSYNNKIQEIFIDRRIHKVLLDRTIFSIEEETDLVIINTNGFSFEDCCSNYNVNNVLPVNNQNEIEYYLQQQNNIGKPLSNSKFSKFYQYIVIDKDIRDVKTKTSLNIHFIKLCASESGIEIEWMKTIGDIKNLKRCRYKKEHVMQPYDKWMKTLGDIKNRKRFRYKERVMQSSDKRMKTIRGIKKRCTYKKGHAMQFYDNYSSDEYSSNDYSYDDDSSNDDSSDDDSSDDYSSESDSSDYYSSDEFNNDEFNNDVYLYNCCMKLENITSLMQNSFIIIAGVPGIGKSTLLKQLSRSASSSDFILFVTLNEHYEYFEENEATKSSAEQHLHHFCKNENAIFKELFKSKQKKHEIFILLDGFDEIAPRFTEIVTKIINELREQNYNIILTTRNVLQNEVEDKFGSFAYSLVPFNKVDVKRYIEKYFDKFVNNMSLDKLKFKRIILELRESDVEFFSNPFNLHFISEIVSKDLENENVNSYKLNQLTFYEKYIDYKFQIYIKKINNSNIDKTMILKYHKYYAIKVLFNSLPNYEDIKEKLNDILEESSFSLHKGGLLIGDINQIFSHRTLAEYFAAKWLFEVFIPTKNMFPTKGEKEFAESVLKIIVLPTALGEIVYSYDYSNCEPLEIDIKGYSHFYEYARFPVTQLFFNLMINQHELHKAAYEGRFKYIKQTFNSNIEATSTLNIFGRTLLHTIILNNKIEYDGDDFKIDNNLIEILIMLLSNVEGILTQRDASQTNAQNYAEQISSYKTPLKIIAYETFVYFNRPFELCEIFNPENLCNCSINQLLITLQGHNKFYSIFHAAKNGRHSVIRQFLDNGIQMILRNKDKKHILHFAAESGKGVLDIIKLFSKREIMELRDVKGKSLIDYALLNNNVVVIDTFSSNELESYDGFGLSAFHKAVIFNKIDIVKCILNKTDINFSCKGGYTAIQYAAMFCYKEIFVLLLSNGADIKSRDKNENSLIHLTISSFYLINNLQFNKNYRLSEYRLSLNKRFFDFISYLLRTELDVNCKNRFGLTPLCLAVYHHDKILIKILIDNLADRKCISNNGISLLHVAASKGDVECLELLLLGDIINVQDKDGNSALHYAAHSFENVDFLIRNGADPTITTNKGLTCLHVAVHPTIEHYRGKSSADATVGSNNMKILELLTNHVDVNVQNINGDTALHDAAYYNRTEMVKYLIEKGAKINLANKDNLTPLDIASNKNQEKQGKSSWTVHNNFPKNPPLTLGDEEKHCRFLELSLTLEDLQSNVLSEKFFIFYLENV